MSVNDWLIVVVCALALFQGTRQRFYISLYFGVSFALHAYFSAALSDFMYYLSDGLVALSVLSVLCAFASPSRFVDVLIGLSASIIILDFSGWFYLYESYLPPTAYNIAYSGVYLIAIYAILKGVDKNGECYLEGLDIFRSTNGKRADILSPLHEEAKL